MDKKKPKCVVCRSYINVGSKKCLACGAWQDWRRYFDFGNTSLSLIIALFSVVALTSDNLIKLFDFLQDKETASLSVKVSSILPKSITFSVDNDGPGRAILKGGAFCSIYPPANRSDVLLNYDKEKGIYSGHRFPKPNEVVGRYLYSYGDDNPVIINSGDHKIFTMKIREISFREHDKSHLDMKDHVKSYCFFSYYHENEKSDGVFKLLEELDIQFFALDIPDVKRAIKEYDPSALSKN